MEINFLLLIFTLVMSAFFSGAEVALFSLEKKQINELEPKNSLLSSYILNLINEPRRLLVTILLGNTIFNVGATIISVRIALGIAEKYNFPSEIVLFAQIVLLTIFILIIGEITPKLFASKSPLTFSKFVAFPLYWTAVIIYPVAKLLTDIIKGLVSKFNFKASSTLLRSSEIADLADIGIEHGSLEEEEHDLIHGLVDFKSLVTREVMTPRVDIVSISSNSSFDNVIEIIQKSGHSRIPIHNDGLDNIVGILYAKDVLSFIGDENRKKDFSLKNISREALFIPETKLIRELLKEFQEKNMHIGIVVDEYGGTAGLISLEDILEEIVGEIQDEYDHEDQEIIRVNDDKIIVLGKVDIDELNELLDDDFKNEDDDYDTVGGFIFQQAGKIPEKGYNFNFSKYNFKVIEIENNRISKVMITKLKVKE